MEDGGGGGMEGRGLLGNVKRKTERDGGELGGKEKVGERKGADESKSREKDVGEEGEGEGVARG